MTLRFIFNAHTSKLTNDTNFLGEDFHFNCAFTVTFLYGRGKKKEKHFYKTSRTWKLFLPFYFPYRPLLKLAFVVYQRWCLTAAENDTVKKNP